MTHAPRPEQGAITRRDPAVIAPPPDLRARISMEEAVGQPSIACDEMRTIEGAVVLKNDRLFLLADRRGDVMPPSSCSMGLYHDDTRFLSELELRVAGGPAALLSTQVLRPYLAQIDLAVSDLAFGGTHWDPKHAVHLRRELLLDDTFVERLTITNHLVAPIDYWIELRVGCDFADIFEVRGWRRDRRGEFFATDIRDHGLLFAYRGLDGVLVRSALHLAERPEELRPRCVRWKLRLEPGRARVLAWEVVPETGAEGQSGIARVHGAKALDLRRSALDEVYGRWRARCSKWTSDVAVFDATLARAIDDLRALYVEADAEDVISAGIPWYCTVFGRDSIITSLETLALHPGIAVDTLRYLARRQGEHENAATEEQPGRILHELRRGEMARSGEIPHVPYYGTVDATPLWLILLHETWRWTGDDALVRALLPNAWRALEWIDRYGDLDGDGFVEYASTSAKGLRNQGWKDSSDGVPFPDGRLPDPPIALVEVQGYVYDAKWRMADLLRRFGDAEAAERLAAEAEALRQRVLEHFWMEEAGTFALALDGDKRPVRSLSSNAGHLLWSRVPGPEEGLRLAESLMERDMFSGWGIRTLSSRHAAYNPMSYHNGSIWPHDNALIVQGFARYGMSARALPVLQAMHDAAAHMEFNRLPELYCGMQRASGNRPVLYPVSCSPQAWASGSLLLMLQAVLGLSPEAPARLLHVQNPVLPGFLRDLTVTGLPVGRSRVSLRFARHRDRTLVNLLEVEGEPIQVRIELG